MILAVLLLLLVTDVLILVHELGHLIAAKWAGMPVTSFSVGFGPGSQAVVGGRAARCVTR